MSGNFRFVVGRTLAAGDAVKIEGADLHHMRNVLRLRPGAAVTLLDVSGVEYQAVLKDYEHAAANVEKCCPVNSAVEAPAELILGAAIIRLPRMDYLIEKAVELGATQIWPLLCRRTPGYPRALREKATRIDRWRRLAEAATKQSLTRRPAIVHDSTTLDRFIAEIPEQTERFICQAQAPSLLVQLLAISTRPSGIVLACGPEGDFDSEEVSMARRGRFAPASLGPNRLRSETAALAALSLAGAAFYRH